MRIQNISKHLYRFSLAAMTIAASSALSSCIWTDERYHIDEPHVQTVNNKNKTEDMFNEFLEDIGMLKNGYRIENIPSVRVEDENGNEIYNIYDKSLNSKSLNSDSLWLRQLIISPDNKYDADTLLFYKKYDSLCVENSRKTIKNVRLSKNMNKTWQETINGKFNAQWYNIYDTLIARDTGKNCYFYMNPIRMIPPKIGK